MNFVNLITGLIPWFLRKVAMVDWFRSFGSMFQGYHNDTMYKAQFTGQVSSLERYLNDQYGLSYDINSRSAQIIAGTIIFIEGPFFIGTYLYNEAENKPPLYLHNASEIPPALPTYILNEAEVTTAGLAPFIVYVPIAVTFDTTVMSAQINQYKEASKSFTIQTY